MESLIHRNGWLYRSTNWSALIGLAVLVLIAIAIVIDVLMRWLFNSPIDGLDDINHLLIAIVLAACFPAVLIQGHNITIRFLGNALGPRASTGLEVFGGLGTLVFLALIGSQFVIYTLELTADNRITEVIEIPMAPWWWITTALMIVAVPVQFIIVMVHFWRCVTGRIPDEEPHDDSLGYQGESDGDQSVGGV